MVPQGLDVIVHEFLLHLNVSPTRVSQIQDETAKDTTLIALLLILKGSRIVIPKSLQPDVLHQLHYAHQGAEKCKLRAKGSVFWANINRDVGEMVKSCVPCQRHKNVNT